MTVENTTKKKRCDEEALGRIAAKLTALREERGEFQRDAARATGLNIGLIETGRRNITLCTIERLCRYYGISLVRFFDEVEL